MSLDKHYQTMKNVPDIDGQPLSLSDILNWLDVLEEVDQNEKMDMQEQVTISR